MRLINNQPAYKLVNLLIKLNNQPILMILYLQVDSSKFTSTASDDGNTWNSVLTMTMSSSLVAVQFSCKYTFSGAVVGTDESLTSTGAQMYLECE